MTKIELIKETLGGIAFGLVFFMMIGLASISDGLDQVIIESAGR